jgi:hypothetical protein
MLKVSRLLKLIKSSGVIRRVSWLKITDFSETICPHHQTFRTLTTEQVRLTLYRLIFGRNLVRISAGKQDILTVFIPQFIQANAGIVARLATAVSF